MTHTHTHTHTHTQDRHVKAKAAGALQSLAVRILKKKIVLSTLLNIFAKTLSIVPFFLNSIFFILKALFIVPLESFWKVLCLVLLLFFTKKKLFILKRHFL